MSIAEVILSEFEGQVPVTRKFLERVPEEHLAWKPHEKSMTAGQLALHIARVPGGIIRFVQANPALAPDFSSIPAPADRAEILNTLEEGVSTVRSLLPGMDDKKMLETWRMVRDGQELFALPRHQFIRDIMLNHWYQHRGQLSVYLRILNVPVPASWGPSADEPPAFVQRAQSA
jgi:uncharacterized damage-inducible protein DinB